MTERWQLHVPVRSLEQVTQSSWSALPVSINGNLILRVAQTKTVGLTQTPLSLIHSISKPLLPPPRYNQYLTTHHTWICHFLSDLTPPLLSHPLLTGSQLQLHQPPHFGHTAPQPGVLPSAPSAWMLILKMFRQNLSAASRLSSNPIVSMRLPLTTLKIKASPRA